jgi:hypothetical protein
MHSGHTEELNLLTLIILLISLISACIFCFEPPRRGYSKNEIIPYKIKLSINKYRLYIYSSGTLRQSLLFLVILALYYSITEPFQSDLIKNLSYSLIATFIFDTGLNFSKENITKGVISQKWHNDLYSAFDRIKAINEILCPKNYEIRSRELSNAIIASFFTDDENSLAKKDMNLRWDLSSDKYLSYKEIVIKKGDNLNAASLRFINDDYNFLRQLSMDGEVFISFPSIMKPLLKGYRVLSKVVNSIKDPSRFNATKKSLEIELSDYLDLRNDLLKDIEEVMGSYVQRAP